MTFAKSATEELEGRWRKDLSGRFSATAFAVGKYERAAIQNIVPMSSENLMLLCPKSESLLMGSLLNKGLYESKRVDSCLCALHFGAYCARRYRR